MNRYTVTNIARIKPDGNHPNGSITDDQLNGKTVYEWIAGQPHLGHGERRFPAADPLGEWTTEDTPDGLVRVIAAVPEREGQDINGDPITVPAFPERRVPLHEIHPEWYRVQPPTLDGDDIVVAPEHVIESEDISATTVAEAQARLWREAWAWGDRQFAEQDRTTVLGWLAAGLLASAGVTKWREVIAWHDAVFTTHYAAAKAAITAAGAWVEPNWSSWPPCPYGFYDFLAERV